MEINKCCMLLIYMFAILIVYLYKCTTKTSANCLDYALNEEAKTQNSISNFRLEMVSFCSLVLLLFVVFTNAVAVIMIKGIHTFDERLKTPNLTLVLTMEMKLCCSLLFSMSGKALTPYWERDTVYDDIKTLENKTFNVSFCFQQCGHVSFAEMSYTTLFANLVFQINDIRYYSTLLHNTMICEFLMLNTDYLDMIHNKVNFQLDKLIDMQLMLDCLNIWNGNQKT